MAATMTAARASAPGIVAGAGPVAPGMPSRAKTLRPRRRLRRFLPLCLPGEPDSPACADAGRSPPAAGFPLPKPPLAPAGSRDPPPGGCPPQSESSTDLTFSAARNPEISRRRSTRCSYCVGGRIASAPRKPKRAIGDPAGGSPARPRPCDRPAPRTPRMAPAQLAPRNWPRGRHSGRFPVARLLPERG